MTETVGPERRVARGDDEFERRLFAMIETGELDFPKGAVRPGDEAAPRGGTLQSLRSRLSRLIPRMPRLFLTAAVAYGLALVVSLPVYLVAFRPSPTTAPAAAPLPVAAPAPSLPPTVGSARVLALGSGPTRGDESERAIVVGDADRFVVLSFLAPIRTGPGIVYRAKITEATGRLVASQDSIRSVDGLGNFVLVCNSELFSAGEYRLTLEEVPASGAVEEHRFPFRVSRPRG
jgi:hypothetical protein